MEWHGAPIKWPYKWVAGFTTAMSGVLGNPTPIFATGPLCSRSVFLKLIGLKTNRAMRFDDKNILQKSAFLRIL